MSLTNDSRNLIDIQNSNITFEEDFPKKESFKKKQCKYIYGKLNYMPTHCQHCGIKDEKKYIIYKNGTQISRITFPLIELYPAYLLFKKQRFMCKSFEIT